MTSVRVHGKVMLSGEYAVLYGGEAVLVPAPRELTVTEQTAPPEDSYPPAVREARELRIYALVDGERGRGVPHLDIDRGAFYAEDAEGHVTKLGLGASAAEAVGTIALRYERAGLPWEQHRAEVIEHALEAHAKAQGGLGSGADVAACGSPGAIRFQNREGEIRIMPVAEAHCALPLNLLWSGRSADTRELVQLFQDWVELNSEMSAAPLDQLCALSNELAPAWFAASPEELLRLLDAFEAALKACIEPAGVPYILPVHARTAVWARRHGGRAKPTGAGGGDMILLVGDLPLDQLKGLVIPLENS